MIAETWLLHRAQLDGGLELAHLYGPPHRRYGHDIQTSRCGNMDARAGDLSEAPAGTLLCQKCQAKETNNDTKG